jgi:hypothetical protein
MWVCWAREVGYPGASLLAPAPSLFSDSKMADRTSVLASFRGRQEVGERTHGLLEALVRAVEEWLEKVLELNYWERRRQRTC